MRNFQEKRSWKRIFESKPVLALLGIIIILFAWSIFGLLGKMQETVKNRQIAEAKIAELEQGKEKLSSDIASLKTNQGLEKSIRDKFGLAKEGEGLIVVVDDKNQPEIKETSNKGFFYFLKNWFK